MHRKVHGYLDPAAAFGDSTIRCSPVLSNHAFSPMFRRTPCHRMAQSRLSHYCCEMMLPVGSLLFVVSEALRTMLCRQNSWWVFIAATFLALAFANLRRS
jgi:hypothetical protein